MSQLVDPVDFLLDSMPLGDIPAHYSLETISSMAQESELVEHDNIVLAFTPNNWVDIRTGVPVEILPDQVILLRRQKMETNRLYSWNRVTSFNNGKSCTGRGLFYPEFEFVSDPPWMNDETSKKVMKEHKKKMRNIIGDVIPVDTWTEKEKQREAWLLAAKEAKTLGGRPTIGAPGAKGGPGGPGGKGAGGGKGGGPGGGKGAGKGDTGVGRSSSRGSSRGRNSRSGSPKKAGRASSSGRGGTRSARTRGDRSARGRKGATGSGAGKDGAGGANEDGEDGGEDGEDVDGNDNTTDGKKEKIKPVFNCLENLKSGLLEEDHFPHIPNTIKDGINPSIFARVNGNPMTEKDSEPNYFLAGKGQGLNDNARYSKQQLEFIIKKLRDKLTQDWMGSVLAVHATAEDLIEISFLLETVDSELGLFCYMSLLAKDDWLIDHFGLRKLSQLWGVKRQFGEYGEIGEEENDDAFMTMGGSTGESHVKTWIFFLFAPAWVKLRVTDAYYTTHPREAGSLFRMSGPGGSILYSLSHG